MGDGVSPEENAMHLCDEENKKDEEYHDATETADTSEAAGGRVAEKSTASADAEMTATEEQKEETSWTRVGGDSNGKVDLKKGRGKATACGRGAAPGGSTFLPHCP